MIASVMTACASLALLGPGSHPRAHAQGQADPDLRAQVEALQRSVNRLSLNNPPVGTVMAYAGEWDRTREQETGWLLCDGRKVKESDYKELFAALKPDEKTYKYNRTDGTFELPNFQGVFLRGVDKGKARDPEGDQRFVGHFQDQSVANHRHHTRLDGGAHEHTVAFIAAVEKNAGDDDRDKDPHGAWSTKFNFNIGGGSHTHDGYTDTDGGGVETRPKNCAVYWIIKFRSGPPPAR